MASPAPIRVLAKLLLLSLFIPFFIIAVLIIFIGTVIRPFSKKYSILLGTVLCYLCWSILDLFFRLTVNLKAPKIPKGNYFVISNHISSTDFMTINSINKHNFKDAKYIVKHTLWFVPILYQGFLLAKFLILKRNFESDRELIEKYLEVSSALNLPMWLVIFCEGHRYTSQLAAESAAFCQSRKIQPCKNVLFPRYKGFETIMRKLPQTHIRKILDITIFSHGRSPSLFDVMLSGRVFDYECDARIVDIEDVGEPKEFLEGAFRRKDEIIEEWITESSKVAL